MERDGNGWIECGLGHRHWGLHGAAGLLLHNVDADGTLRLLLQHRADWCHHGGTWGLPGGARDSHETVEQAALREAAEETSIDVTEVRVRHTFVDDHGGWSYTTVYGDSVDELATDPNEESAELSWVASDGWPTCHCTLALGTPGHRYDYRRQRWWWTPQTSLARCPTAGGKTGQERPLASPRV